MCICVYTCYAHTVVISTTLIFSHSIETQSKYSAIKGEHNDGMHSYCNDKRLPQQIDLDRLPPIDWKTCRLSSIQITYFSNFLKDVRSKRTHNFL